MAWLQRSDESILTSVFAVCLCVLMTIIAVVLVEVGSLAQLGAQHRHVQQQTLDIGDLMVKAISDAQLGQPPLGSAVRGATVAHGGAGATDVLLRGVAHQNVSKIHHRKVLHSSSEMVTNRLLLNLTRESASRWLDAAATGTCGRTPRRVGAPHANCHDGVMGSFASFATQHHKSWNTAVLACLNLCGGCDACRFVSVSLKWRDCSWFRACSLSELDTGVAGFKSGVAANAMPTPDRGMARVCVATVCTGERLVSLHRLAASWSGLLSIAFLSTNITRDAVHGLDVLRWAGRLPVNPSRVTVTIVSNQPASARPYILPGAPDVFPTNMLRNIATDGCGDAEAVLTLDVDFSLCCGDVDSKLSQYVTLVRNRSVAVVLPAFEVHPLITVATKADLARHVASKRAWSFQSKLFPPSHACDQWRKWFRLKAPFETSYTVLCEPYTLVERASVPPYDEIFVGYGKNRMSFHYELAARGVHLRVVPDLFLLHPTGTLNRTVVESSRRKEWWVGETCWPEFRERIHKQYAFRPQNSLQAVIQRDSRVKLPCMARSNRLCVGECRPLMVRFVDGQLPIRIPPRGRPLRT
jgi:hypothetical protein